jgi:predicted DsbA family dithiol-disulfide isomerase
LNPGIPEDGAKFRDYMLAKGGHRIALEDFFAGPREAGRKAGLVFNFEQIEVAPNTLHAHRLVELTPAEDQPQMIDALYTAYFEETRDVGDRNVLADIAAELGMDRAEILQRLESDEAQDVVWQKVQHAQQLGISGVPFFVFNNRLAASGAQPPEVLLQVLEQSQGEIPIR